MSNNDAPRRVRFYGLHDLATWTHVERVVEVIEKFDAASMPATTTDAIELHNIQQYIENDLPLQACAPEQRTYAGDLVPKIQAAVARFFTAVDESNCVAIVAGIHYNYHADLLELLGRNKAYERCNSDVMLPALDAAGVHIGEMLACKKLVETYETAIRDKLLASPQNAVYVIRKYLERDTRKDIYLPASLTANDKRDLLERYLDSPEANPNYTERIESAPSQVLKDTGIDAKLKLKAKRRNAEMNQKLFKEATGLRIAIEVGTSDTQDESVACEVDHSDGVLTRYTYSSRWLEETLDKPSILNNFQHLFEFANDQVLLNLPSYTAQLSHFESLRMTGETEYQIGTAFIANEMLTSMLVQFYRDCLETKGIDLEDVISWFFNTYLGDEFGALNFSFTPSPREASYLGRVRHLFPEMEGVVNQFRLFVQEGELDPELLAIDSNQVRYKEIPSLLDGKYIYLEKKSELAGIIHALFSSQSGLCYIRGDLRGHSAVDLLLNNEVAYGEFHAYQQGMVDDLIKFGFLHDTGTRVLLRNPGQFIILKSLFAEEAVSYFHLPEVVRAEADAMERRGWVTRRSSLLTEAEADYFNYYLNKVDFSNGPELRNKYAHGSQSNADGEDAHFQAYITALKLMIALVIKINDDFYLSVQERAVAEN